LGKEAFFRLAGMTAYVGFADTFMKSFFLGVLLATVALFSTGCVSTKNVSASGGDMTRFADARLGV
jgi:hypothetical protein